MPYLRIIVDQIKVVFSINRHEKLSSSLYLGLTAGMFDASLQETLARYSDASRNPYANVLQSQVHHHHTVRRVLEFTPNFIAARAAVIAVSGATTASKV